MASSKFFQLFLIMFIKSILKNFYIHLPLVRRKVELLPISIRRPVLVQEIFMLHLQYFFYYFSGVMNKASGAATWI